MKKNAWKEWITYIIIASFLGFLGRIVLSVILTAIFNDTNSFSMIGLTLEKRIKLISKLSYISWLISDYFIVLKAFDVFKINERYKFAKNTFIIFYFTITVLYVCSLVLCVNMNTWETQGTVRNTRNTGDGSMCWRSSHPLL